jgi:hypothetical protein
LFSRRVALAGGFAAPFLLRSQPSLAKDSSAACQNQLARLFPNSLDAARALGKACGDGRGLDSLLDGLCETPEERRHLVSAPLDELRVAIEKRIRADYVYGRTRRIDGWVLSETETRLFAIVAA